MDNENDRGHAGSLRIRAKIPAAAGGREHPLKRSRRRAILAAIVFMLLYLVFSREQPATDCLGGPDLAARIAWPTPALPLVAGVALEVPAVVANVGESKADDFTVQLFDDEGQLGERHLEPGLEAGEMVVVKLPITRGLGEGPHDFRVEVSKVTGEAVTANNQAEGQIRIVAPGTREACLRSRDLSLQAADRLAVLPVDRPVDDRTGYEVACLAAGAYESARRCEGGVDRPELYDALRGALELFEPERHRIGRAPGTTARNLPVVGPCPAGPLLDIPDCVATAPELSPGERRASRAPVRTSAFEPEGRWLAAGSEDGHIHLLDLVGGDALHLGEMPGGVRALAIDGRHLFAGSFDGAIRVWSCDFRLGHPCRSGRSYEGLGASVNALTFGPAGEQGSISLASGDSDGRVRVWSSSGDELNEVRAFDIALADFPSRREPKVYSVAFSPAGDVIAAATSGGTLLWEYASGGHRWLDASRDVRSVAFSPSDQPGLLVSGDYSGEIAVWSWPDATQDDPEWLGGHRSSVNALSFIRANGFASASSDGTIRVWTRGAAALAAPVVLSGHDSWIWTLAFRPKAPGQQLVSGSQDRTVRIWTTTAGCFHQALASKIPGECETWLASLP